MPGEDKQKLKIYQKKYRKNQYENMSEKDAQKKIISKNTKNPIQKYVKENQRKQ